MYFQVFPVFLVTEAKMDQNEIVERVCRLPVEFYGGSKSMLQLVAESGIAAFLALLTAPNLLGHITTHSELVEEWLRWSANKRVTSGWYFRCQGDHYIVGFHPEGEVMTFGEPALACAEFVVREVDALVAMILGPKR
jgi:hypothetical protein